MNASGLPYGVGGEVDMSYLGKSGSAEGGPDCVGRWWGGSQRSSFFALILTGGVGVTSRGGAGTAGRGYG